MVVPAFALVEPYWTLRKNGDVRRRLCNEVEKEIKQLSRSPRYSQFTPQASDVVAKLAQIESYERTSLDEVVSKLTHTAEIVELKGELFLKPLKIPVSGLCSLRMHLSCFQF